MAVCVCLSVCVCYGMLLEVTGGYMRLREDLGCLFLSVSVCVGGYGRLREITGGCRRLREVTRGYGRLREALGCLFLSVCALSYTVETKNLLCCLRRFLSVFLCFCVCLCLQISVIWRPLGRLLSFSSGIIWNGRFGPNPGREVTRGSWLSLSVCV